MFRSREVAADGHVRGRRNPQSFPFHCIAFRLGITYSRHLLDSAGKDALLRQRRRMRKRRMHVLQAGSRLTLHCRRRKQQTWQWRGESSASDSLAAV